MGFGPSWLSNSLTALNAGNKVLDGGTDSLDLSALKLQNIKAAFDEVQNVLKDTTDALASVASGDVAAAADDIKDAAQALAAAAEAAGAAAAAATGSDGPAPKGIYLDLTTPLAKDLTIDGFSGEERLSSPFSFVIDCHSSKATLDFTKLIGKQATIKIGIGDNLRYINGIATRFGLTGVGADRSTYELELRPWLWLLTLTRQSRIFQQKSVPDIIEAVFKEYGFEKHKKSLTGTYAARDYTVQHQESDFDFVCRLMEDEGIFYYFDHTDSDHTLVLADDPSAHQSVPGLDEVTFFGLSEVFAADVIADAQVVEQITTNAYTMGDHNFETPKTTLRSQVKGSSPTLQIYEYPGGFTKSNDGDSRVKKRIEAMEEPAKLFAGTSRVRGFLPGYKFKLTRHPVDDVNAEYVLRSVSHWATSDRYENRFDALPSKTPFRPPIVTPKPRIAGSEIATVTGKSGEEIWTDKYGRIKVQFPWDRDGKNDENTTCWIRVAQHWAGKQWGTWILPRIGMEVIVTFLDGDPDRPLVTGVVHNAVQTVSYGLPDNQTKSTMKTNSSKGGGGFNEWRFEDKKGSEEIFIQAQKDNNNWIKNDRTTKIDHDETLTVKNDRKLTVVNGDDVLTVAKGNRTVEIKTGFDNLKVSGQRQISITGDETHENGGLYSIKVAGDYTLKVTGDMTITVTGQLTMKASDDISLEGDMNVKAKAAVGYNIQGTMVTIKGAAQGSVQAGANQALKGGMVMIN